jgi:cell division protein FtsI/penicillin-binding protein 2
MSDGKVQRRRIRIVIGLVVFAGALVIFRLFSLQVINGSSYRERAERQYVTPSGTLFDRGNIYFSNKDATTVAGATVATGFKIAITPSRLTSIEHTYDALHAIVPIDKEEFFQKASKKNDPYEEVYEHATTEEGEKLGALGLPGVQLVRQKWRLYPGGSLAANTIGFVSYKGNDLVGNYGIEEYYNDVLTKQSNNFYVNFFAEIFANMQSTVFKNRTATGDVVTSIEPTVQSELEHAISGVQSKWASETVGGVVLDPYTGEILAMATAPTFDLNSYGSEKNVRIYNNPLSQSVYEMGSIVKPLVMAAGIDTGVVTPTTSYNDAGSVVVRDKTISNFDKKGRGHVTMQDVLNQSLNTGMVFVEQKLGHEKFKEYMLERYRVGEKTGVDLPGEVNGIVGNLKGENDVNYATASFGQGIATTPLNIVRGFAALANGGTLITPHVATAIRTESGSLEKLTYAQRTGIIKPETAATMATMLTHVVDDGYHKGLANYRVAAKTGTAQIAKPNGQGYYEDRNLHSLIGYFPATKPRFVIYMFNVYPKGAQFAIQSLADPFFGMVQFLANYYEIAPDR